MTVLLLGFGVEGKAAARYFLQHTKQKILIYDDQPVSLDGFETTDRLTLFTQGELADAIQEAKLVLRSPGLPPDNKAVEACLTAGHSITTPTGYWLKHHAPSGTITITGTKGKSTTTSLLVHLMQQAGMDAVAMGNIGRPPLDEQLPTATHPVLELSSYMMHDLPEGPYTHLITSLYKEHTNWHGGETAYRAAKLRPFRFTPPAPGYAPLAVIKDEKLPQDVRAFEDCVPIENGQLLIGNTRLDPADCNERFHSLPELMALRAATSVLLEFMTTDRVIDALLTGLKNYKGLPCRQEIIPSHDGRVWVNDTLATVPEAVMTALRRWEGAPITLLLGGADRGQSFEQFANDTALFPHLTIISFGSISGKVIDAYSRHGKPVTVTHNLIEALSQADKITEENGVILFSPGAASEAPYANYLERSDDFRKAAEATRAS